MNALWASAATPTAEATTAEYRLQGFSPTSITAPRLAAAWTHRTRRFSCAHPPNLARAAHRGRTATTFRPLCQSPRTSPRGARQPQPADPFQDRGEELAWHRHLGQLEEDILGVGHHLGPDLDELLAECGQTPVLGRL